MEAIRVTSGEQEFGRAWSLESAIRGAARQVPWHRAVVFWTVRGEASTVVAVRSCGGEAREVDFAEDAFAWWKSLPQEERDLLAADPHRAFGAGELPSLRGKGFDEFASLSLEGHGDDGSGVAEGLVLNDDVADFIDAVTGASSEGED
ncbi:hypothetical protein [Brachybacterium alimentarium]|uniref:hypothetical protein n=1 Tax=Brachybacterium alimentarium TaxID=47845 RepID=UPI003FD3D29E